MNKIRYKYRFLSHTSLQAHAEELLSLDCKLHRQLVDDLLGIAVHNERDSFLGGNAALVAVKELVFADFAGRCLVFHDCCVVVHVHIGEGMCSALTAQQERVAAAVVASAVGCGCHLDQASIGILALACADALRDDGASGVLADVYHLGARIGLLVVVRHSHAVELCLTIIAKARNLDISK